MKSKKLILIVMFSLFIIIVLIFGAMWSINTYIKPSESTGQKHVRDFWEHAIMKQENEVYLDSSYMDDNDVVFFCQLTNYETISRFNDNELLIMKNIVEQLIDYLNSSDDELFQNKEIEIYFATGIGDQPRGIRVYLNKVNGNYVLDKLSGERACSLSQLALFEKVNIIEYTGNIDIKETLESLSGLTNLNDLIIYDLSEDEMSAFVNGLPNCNIQTKKSY